MFIILGCDETGKEAFRYYREKNKEDGLFCDIDDIKNGEFIDGVRVVSFADMVDRRSDSNIVIADEYNYDRIALELLKTGTTDFDIYFNNNGGVRRITDYDGEYGILNYLQFRIIDHCNLNCKSCGSVCNRHTPHSYVPAESFEKDVRLLRERIPIIGRIHILGGEPFLHPELDRILDISRKYYEETLITVVTNGLLIEEMSEKLIESFRKNRVAINISGYPPVMKNIDRIAKFISCHRIVYSVRPVEKFCNFRRMNHRSDIKKAWDSCVMNSCTNYKGGILCGCSMIEAFEKMNMQFNMGYCMKKDEDYFDLYETECNIHTIIKSFCIPKHMCGYCDDKPPTWFGWSLPEGEISVYDYVVDELNKELHHK